MLETDDHNWYILGYPDHTFRAENDITRAEVSMIFFRLLKDSKKNNEVENTFTDVGEHAWYEQAVKYLAKIEILQGYEDTTFRPDQAITRAEFATIAARFDFFVNDRGNPFIDVYDDNWAYDYILSSYFKGWVVGYDDNTFKPSSAIIRAEVVTIVNRVLGRRLQKEDIPQQYLNLFTDINMAHWAFADAIESAVTHEYARKPDGYEIWEELN